MDFQQIRKYVKGVLTNSFLNKTTLDKLSTSDEGNLLFNGKGINGDLYNYSTEEQVVGTWINGKPIYEKVINVENFIIGDNEIPLENLDTIINYSGSLILTDYANYKRVFPYIQNNNTSKVVINHYNETKFVVASAFTCNTINIIIQYTKTTD